MASTTSLWRHRDFVKLWSGQTVSELGSSVTQIALPLVAVITLHASAFEVGALTAATTAAFLLVGLPAGAIVDRLRRRPVLVAADIGRTILYGSIPVASALGHLTLLQLYVVALAAGVQTVFFDVAYQSYLPALVDRAQLVEGNGKLTATEAMARVAGPGVGGALVGWVGAATAMAADAVSYVVSVLSILAIRRPEPAIEPPAGGRPTLRRDIGEGLRFVLHHPLLSRIAGCTGTSNLGTTLAFAVAPVFMVRTLHLSAGLIGVVFAVGSLGGVLGALITPWVSRRLGVGRAILFGAVLSAVGPFLWPLASPANPMVPLIVGDFIIGVAVPVYNVGQVSLRQAITPLRLQGRMNASMRFIVWGTMPIGGLVGGALAGLVGLRTTLLVGASVAALANLWIVFSPVPRIRVIPDQAEDDEHADGRRVPA